MANSTIPNLVAVSVPALTDLFGVRQSGDTRDKKLTAAQLVSLAGDVFKVGTPSAGLFGVWTGDGTIEAISEMTLGGGVLVINPGTETRPTGDFLWQGNSGNSPAIVDAFGDLTTPTLIPLRADLNTGIGGSASDQLALVAGGVTAMYFRELSGGVLAGFDSNVGLTAAVGSSQGDGPITASYNVYSIVANPGDAATLPDVFLQVGIQVHIQNDGANSMDVFPASGDDLGQGTDVALAVPAGASVGFLATSAGSTWTQIIFAASAGGGDVTKVGTPANDQIGIWTGDGTIEGDDQFLWDGSALTVGFTNAGPQLLNEVASETNPTIVPTRNDTDTGIGHDAADRMAIIAGGVTVAHVQESGGAPAFIIDPNDAGSGDPELGFGPGGDTGWRESADVLTLILGGASKWGWDADLYVSITPTGAGLKNEVVSATNPTFVPNRSDLNSGIGQNAVDQVSIIAGGIEIARAVEDAVEQFIVSPGAILGTAALPSLAFGDGDSGIRESVDDTLKVTLAGVDRWTFTADRFVGVVGNGPSLQNEASTATNPTLIPALGDVSTGIGGVTGSLDLIVGAVTAIHLRKAGADIFVEAGPAVFEGKAGSAGIPTWSFRLDTNTGMYSGGAGSDELKFSAGGVEALSLNELNSGVIQAHQANVAITAFATGGQASATQLDESYNVITTVATTGDSVKLPPVFAVNSVVYIKNNGANAADVFPATGDDLGAGLNTAVSLAAGESASFIATVASATWTPWIVSVGGGGGGDVTKVGTPVNNQIGVWTGDGTIEGDADFTWDGAHLLLPLLNDAATPTLAFGDGDTGFYESSDDVLRVSCIGSHRFSFNGLLGGNFISQQGNGPQIRNVASSNTIPTLNPRQGDPNTGIGTGADDQLSLIAGAVMAVQIIETGAAISAINMFGPIVLDADFRVTDVAGPSILNEAATGINPTVVPNRADADTGIGSLGADTLSLIAGGVEMLRLSESTTDQVLIGPAGTAAAPSISFVVDPDTGFYSAVPGILAVSVDGTGTFRFVGAQFRGATGGSPSIQNEVASATNPTLLPTQTDLDTGIGWTATDHLSLVAGALDCINIRETGGARQVGFYVTAPISLQTGVAVSSAGIHAALVALGLITA